VKNMRNKVEDDVILLLIMYTFANNVYAM